MFLLRSKTTRIFVLLAFVLILAAATYGFADANTFTGGSAMNLGEGSATIAGYQVTVAYNLNSSNPRGVDAIDLTLDKDATMVQISIDGGTNWITCTGAAKSWSCTTTGLTVFAHNSLKVFASDQTIIP